MMGVGFGICGGLFINLVGAALGIVGLFQKDRSSPFPILGLIVNGAALLGVAVLVIIGLAAK